ncbi:MAG: endonuclease/exonuclease/phosphatase family protein [Bdellovibrionales bacterium]|nr:endonuclease/exonuclease/phosphatase family protein [Bdellovibrionales bacterium]
MDLTKLRFLTWNIGYAYGLGSEGTSAHGSPYQEKPRDHFESALNSMGDFIANIGVDIVFLQEVDFHSKRSHNINQLEWISRRSNLLHRSAVVSWSHPYVPYPGLNPRNHFGPVNSGGGILSRYPIEPLNIDLLPKPRENGTLYNFFYLSRYLQVVSLQVPHRPAMRIMNLHLEAFSQSNRDLHLQKTAERLPDFDIAVAGGDFNGPITLTESASKDWQVLNYEGFTFPCNRPDQAIDGFVAKKSLPFSKPQVLDSGDLSDHRPLFVEASGV